MPLGEMLAIQAAIAIENARLFGEMQIARDVAEAATDTKSTFLANMTMEILQAIQALILIEKDRGHMTAFSMEIH